MSTAQPALVSTEGSSDDTSTQAVAGVDVSNGGGEVRGQSEVDAEEEEEHTFDEELNLKMRESRAYMDDGYNINDEEIEGGDMPGQGSAGGWNQRSCQEELFWEQVEDALRHWNVKRMKHTRDNRRGFCLIDDDKCHYERHSHNHRHWNVKKMKHTRDNRRGFC